MHIVGYCNLQRPVIYSCLEMANNRVVEDNKAHMISTFERVLGIWMCRMRDAF